VIRLAAVGDLHYGVDSEGLGDHLDGLEDHADLLLLAGDLTRVGAEEEAQALAAELAGVSVPCISVLGNHDHHSGAASGVRRAMERAGVTVLEGEGVTVSVDGVRIGVAGVKGFGGGFAGACGADFGEPEMKAFIRHSHHVAERLHESLESLRADIRVVLTHYAPVKDTLAGERLEIFPFLGSYLLAQAIDSTGADLAVHGHAHNGSEKGVTPGGVHVRNVAQPVIRSWYRVYRAQD